MYLLLIIYAVLPTSAAYVNCKLACQHCSRDVDLDPQILEVYCAMCKECKERRRERMQFLHEVEQSGNASGSLFQRKPVDNLIPAKRDKPVLDREYHYYKDTKLHGRQQEPSQEQSQELPECPTPPPCETSEEYVTEKLKSTVTTTVTTTTTTERTTVQEHKCPPVQDTCRRKKPPPPCVPCMPMCMTPCPRATTTPLTPETTSATTGFLYVYLGIPKKLMKHD